MERIRAELLGFVRRVKDGATSDMGLVGGILSPMFGFVVYIFVPFFCASFYVPTRHMICFEDHDRPHIHIHDLFPAGDWMDGITRGFIDAAKNSDSESGGKGSGSDTESGAASGPSTEHAQPQGTRRGELSEIVPLVGGTFFVSLTCADVRDLIDTGEWVWLSGCGSN